MASPRRGPAVEGAAIDDARRLGNGAPEGC